MLGYAMAWNEPGGGNRDPWSGGGRDQGPPDLDEVVRKLSDKFGALLPGGIGDLGATFPCDISQYRTALEGHIGQLFHPGSLLGVVRLTVNTEQPSQSCVPEEKSRARIAVVTVAAEPFA